MLHLVGMGSGGTAAAIAGATIVLLMGLSGNATACACGADGSASLADSSSIHNATVLAAMGAEFHNMANSTGGNVTSDVEGIISGLPEQIQHWYDEADRIKNETGRTVRDKVLETYGDVVRHWPKNTPAAVAVKGVGGPQPVPQPPHPGVVLMDFPDDSQSSPSEDKSRAVIEDKSRAVIEDVIGERPGDEDEEEPKSDENATAQPEEAVNETVRSESAGVSAVDSDDSDPAAPDPEDSTPPTRDMRPLVKTPEVAHEIPPTALVLMAAAGLSFVAVLTLILSKTRFLARIIATGPLAGLFSRQTGRQVLQHPVRANIHAAITQNPGITSAALSEVTRCVPSTLRYHLDILRREDLIKVTRRGGVLHYHDVGARVDGQAQAREHLFWRDRGSLAITILQHPGANQKSVARITGLLPSRVSEYTKELAKAGLVRSERVGRYRQYFPTPMLQAMMADGQVPTSR